MRIPLSTALPARGSRAWVGRAAAQPPDLRRGVNPLLPPPSPPKPCPLLAASRSGVCAAFSAEDTCASFPTLLRPFRCGFSPPLGARERLLEEEQGEEAEGEE